MAKVLMKGNEALAESALRAGCRFFSGYPITPQTEILEYILSELQKVANHYGFLKNGVLIQEFSSSEIADTDLETFYFKNFL